MLRKLSILFSLLFLSIGVCAQENVYIAKCKTNNSHFDISASRKQGVITVYLSTIAVISNYPSSTELEKQVFLITGERNIRAFITSLTEVRNKFIDWVEVAHKNNITSLNKEMNISFPEICIHWTSFAVHRHQKTSTPNPTYRNCRIKLQPVFLLQDNEWVEKLFDVKKNVPYVVFSGKATSANNQFIETQYNFSFSSVNEIDELIANIQIDTIEEKLDKRLAKDSLFK